MAWRLDGNILIACNCDWGCPCNFNARPTRGDCEGGWIWRIDAGEIDGVAVDGLGVAVFADWPGAIHEGGGRAVCFIDERANEVQAAALTRLVRGEVGGPWGIFINTYALEGPSRVPFDVALKEYETSARVGNAVDLRMERMRNPVTGNPVHPEMVLPEGLVVKRGRLARSARFLVRAGGIEYDHSGQYAAFANFSYSS